MTFPKISIITPSYNQGQYLEQTILSILNQDYPNLEYIIIDGGSTDSSVDIIKKYSSKLKYWVSEKDSGQTDALNKGLKHCTGEIFNWVNSDDYLAEGALFKIAQAFQSENPGIVAGVVQNFNNSELKELCVNRLLSVNELLNPRENYVYHQPGVWMRMDIMRIVGEFRIDYHYCFDQEYLLRYLMHNEKVNYIPGLLAYFRLHDLSKTSAQTNNFWWEFNKMYKQFWQMNKGTDIEALARAKSLHYEWPLLRNSINTPNNFRLANFFAGIKAIMKDPKTRLNKKSIGWLKHILFGKRIYLL